MTKPNTGIDTGNPLEPAPVDSVQAVPPWWTAPIKPAVEPGRPVATVRYDRPALRKQLERHEGRAQAKLHLDNIGFTIGIGHNVRTNHLPPEIMEMLLDHAIDVAIGEGRLGGATYEGMTPQERQAFKDRWKAMEGHEPRSRMDPNWRPGQDIFIGYGYNLTRLGMPPHTAERLYQIDIENAEKTAREFYPDFDTLSDAHQRVLVDMAFNQGPGDAAKGRGLKSFQGFGKALKARNTEEAVEQMLLTRLGGELNPWIQQVGRRAILLAYMVAKGKEWEGKGDPPAKEFPEANRATVQKAIDFIEAKKPAQQQQQAHPAKRSEPPVDVLRAPGGSGHLMFQSGAGPLQTGAEPVEA